MQQWTFPSAGLKQLKPRNREYLDSLSSKSSTLEVPVTGGSPTEKCGEPLAASDDVSMRIDTDDNDEPSSSSHGQCLRLTQPREAS